MEICEICTDISEKPDVGHWITLKGYVQKIIVATSRDWDRSAEDRPWRENIFSQWSDCQNTKIWWHQAWWERGQRTARPCSSVQFSCSVVSDLLWLHGPQHARPPCPSPAPGVHPNPCPSSRWCHPTISSLVVLSSSCPQSFPASGSFPMSQLFTSGGQSIGVSASTSVLPMNTQDWSPLGWTAGLGGNSCNYLETNNIQASYESVCSCNSISLHLPYHPRVHRELQKDGHPSLVYTMETLRRAWRSVVGWIMASPNS